MYMYMYMLHVVGKSVWRPRPRSRAHPPRRVIFPTTSAAASAAIQRGAPAPA